MPHSCNPQVRGGGTARTDEVGAKSSNPIRAFESLSSLSLLGAANRLNTHDQQRTPIPKAIPTTECRASVFGLMTLGRPATTPRSRR
jgi:hypothetical protein